ncbi:autotransporter-associated beta strand repeat-containing protein [Pinirhizobacter soli]|uniref:autotransporter-associated beta strand repeat-containing protein n=1 Tax=Pinirhizobacter soli TaxID=2786953 RepID=UPI00202A20D6|nr:autotransporter-associated beta strand repeat-containing protein [Pinirhizobacter soli]
MNRIYRLVWNRALRVLQVASELSTQRNGSQAAGGRCLSTRLWLKPLAMAMVLATPWLGGRAYAACTPANPTAGATVTCTGAANILAPSYAATANNLTVNVQAGGSAGVLLGIGGTAMTLTGNNTTLNNAGTIDPSLLGLLSLLSSGTFIGNSAASTVTVNNQATGVMNGTSGLLGVSINGLTGMALATQNGTGGVTNITNAGTIGGNALLGVSLIPSDIPVVAAYGGAQVNFVNTGTINGRVGFQASQTPGTGNTFANAGTINGGVSMGINSTNTFTAVSGSSVNLAGGIGLDLNVLGLVGVTLGFAPTGVVDGGAGGNNTLVLQNVLPSSGTGSGTGGAISTLSSGTYINFQHLRVNSGTWNLQGPLVSGDATLNGGLVNFNNGGVFGTNAVSANGGAIAASTGGLTLANNMTLGTGGLTIAGTNNFTLSGTFSGSGGLTQSSSGVTTLTGAHTYTGPTTISAGTLALASAGALPLTGPVNLSGATAIFDISGTASGATIGSLTGVAGSQVTLGPRTLTTGDANNTTFAGSASGTGGVVKQGTGTLTLAGANTYIGGTTVSAGVLSIAGGGSLAATGALTLGAGTALDISGATANQAIGDLTGASGSQILLGARTLTAGGAASTLYSGVISGGGGLVKQGAGTLTLSGANTYAGGTTINAGTLQGDTTSLQGNILDNATVAFNQAGNGLYAGVISGTGDLAKSGAGTLTLGGVNSYTGNTRIDAGTLALAAGSSIASSSGVTLATGSTFDLSAAGNQTLGLLNGAGGTVALGANTLTLNGVGNATFGGVLAGSGGLVMNGSGTQTLTGANLYAGGTLIENGTLALGAGGSLAAGSPVTLTGGVLDLSTSGNQSIANLDGTGGQVQLGGGSALTVDSGNFAGAITGNGSLIKAGLGNLVLDGANSYSGGTQVVSGGLVIGSDAAHGAAGIQSDVSVASTGSIGGFGHVDGNIDVLAGGHLAPGAPSGTFTVNGNLTLAQGSLIDASFGAPGPDFNTPGASHGVQVNGNLALSGAALTPVDAGGFGPGLYNLFNYTGTLTQANGGISTPVGYAIQNLTGSKQINLINALGIDLNIWNADGLASPTQMGGGSGVWSQVNANWTDATGSITGVRSPADAFVIFGGNAGTVTVDGAGGAQPVTTQGIQFASDGYHLNGDALGLVAPSAGAYSEIRVGDGSAASAGWTATIDNAIAGNGLQKTGDGTLVLNGANTYTQGTQLVAGTLSVSSDANLGNSGNAVDFEGGTLQVTGTAYTSTPRAIVFGAAGGGFDIADAANTFTVAQPLTGTGGLTKLGDGTLVLAGANTYSGGTTISAGTLQGDTGSLQGNITDNGSLVFNQGTDGTFAGVVSGTGSLTKDGAGTLTLDGAHTYTGITLIDNGTLKIGPAGSLASSAGVGLAAGTTLDLSGSGDQSLGLLNGAGGTVDLGPNTLTLTGTGNGSYAGTIIGSGALVKDGASTQTLSGTNLYSGGTTVNDGALILGAGGSLAANSDVTVNGNGVLDVSAAGNQALGNFNGNGGQVQLGGNTLGVGAGTYDGVIAGTGGLQKSGSGTLTLNGSNTYTGPTQVTAGTLLVGDAAHASASVQSDVTVANTGVLGGFGQVNGDVVVQSGGHLAPGNPVGIFTVNGNLLAEQGSQLDFSFGVPGVNSNTPGQGHNVQVNGDLTLEGAALNPRDAGGFGPGLYNLFDYTGTLTQANGGITPPAGGYTIQYLTGSKQVNLITTAGMALSFWNANGLASATRMGGGNGVWAQANANWTDAQGAVTSVRVPVNAFVIFGGDAGTVTVDDAGGTRPVPTLGIQFATDGYHLNGDTLTLDSATQTPLSEIRVGDGSAGSANWTATIDNVLVGAGVNKTGLGTLVLNGVNAYTQATQLTQGTLSVSSDANLGAPSAGIDFEGGTLRVTGTAFDTTARAITLGAAGGGLDIADTGNTFTVSQALTGAGGVTKLGDGTLVLAGANTYSGGTTISGGTLQGDSSSLQGNITDNAALVFDQAGDGTFSGIVSGTGSVTKQGAGMLTLSGANTYAGGTTISAGTLAGNATSLQGAILDNGSLVFNQAVDGTFQGSITGTGTFAKTGQGMLLLTGQNAFAGTTSIEDGSLAVGNATTPSATLGGNVTVQAGGTLLGSGTIEGDVTNNGVIHPGNPVGTLTIDGNFTQNASGKFIVEIAADGTGSQLAVSGKASLAGSALLVMPSSNWQANADYRILTANGGVSGQFGLVNSNFAFVNPTLVYDATSVGLSLQRNAVTFPSTASTRNGQAVAAATEQLGPGNPVYDAVVILDRPTAAAAFQQLQADIHASTRTAILDNDRYVRDAVNAHLSGTTSQASGSEANTAEGGSVWTSVWGHWGDHDSDGNATELSANGSGIALGADTSIGSAGRVGALVAKGQGTARSWTPDTSSRHVDSYAGLYADFRLDAFHLQAGAIYGWQKVTANRFIAVDNIRGSAGSRYDANTSQGYLEGSYEVGIGHSSLAPFINIAYDHLSTDPIHERGSVAAFNVDGEGSSITVGTLGARGNFQLNDDGGLRAIVSLGWQHAWGDVTPMNSMRYVAGGPSFTIAGVPVAKNAAAFTGGVSFLVAPKVSVDATYSGQFASHATDQAARLSLTWMF